MGLTSSPPCTLCQWSEVGSDIYTLKSSVKAGEDNTFLPQQRRARESLINPVMCPPGYKMQIPMQEFHKRLELKINKLNSGYSATTNLIFQSWLKNIRIHVEDHNLTERQAMELIKDFTAECAHNEVEFYMGMVVEDQQTFEGLIQHLKNAFQSGETISKLISNFYHQAQKKNESEDVIADDLQVLVQKIIVRKLEFRVDANEQLKNQYAHKL